MRYHRRVPGERYHGLDALRAAMMLLGIVFHSMIFYMTAPLWGFGDSQTSLVFNLLFYFISFRMPIFFMIAGFFGALLLQREGATRFVRNRMQRILLPLVLFWLTLRPLGGALMLWTLSQFGVQVPSTPATSDQPLWRQPLLGGVWFLWDLLLFYAAALAVLPIAARLPLPLRRSAAATFRRVAASPAGAFPLAAVTILLLLRTPAPNLTSAAALVPPLSELVGYGIFFAFGWRLYRERDLLAGFAARCHLPFAAGVTAAVAYSLMIVFKPLSGTAEKIALRVLIGLALWLLAFGATGVFHRYLDRPRPSVRYMADASYWMYLAQIIPLAIVPGLLAPMAWPAFVKFAIVLGVTIGSTLVTYHYFVRSTVIGLMLNGRRYPRAHTDVRRDHFAAT